MSALPHDSSSVTRRFLVVTDEVTIATGTYCQGDVITDRDIGLYLDGLLNLDAIREIDYDLTLLSR